MVVVAVLAGVILMLMLMPMLMLMRILMRLLVFHLQVGLHVVVLDESAMQYKQGIIAAKAR